MFGKDVSLPETKLSYHVQSSVGAEDVAAGARPDLHPAAAVDARPVAGAGRRHRHPRHAGGTFSDIDQRAFRANLLHRHRRRAVRRSPALMTLLALVRLLSALPEAGRRRAHAC